MQKQMLLHVSFIYCRGSISWCTSSKEKATQAFFVVVLAAVPHQFSLTDKNYLRDASTVLLKLFFLNNTMTSTELKAALNFKVLSRIKRLPTR